MHIETIKLWPDRDDVELTTFLAMPDTFLPVRPKMPAVIVCPGGAYMSCPRHGTEGDPIAMFFAAQGYQAFVLEYSVASRAPQGAVLFPAQLIDFGKALLTVRENAEQWSIDVDKISVIGFSAGAHLCGMLATSWHEPLLSERFGVPAECFKPLCAMLMYPVADYAVQLATENKADSILAGADNLTPVFGTDKPTPEQLERYSPSKKVSENTPPLFVAAARDDGMVTPLNSINLAYACLEKGVPFELHLYENGDHGFSNGNNILRPWRSDRALDCSAWKQDVLRFLLRHCEPVTAKYQHKPFEEILEWRAQLGV